MGKRKMLNWEQRISARGYGNFLLSLKRGEGLPIGPRSLFLDKKKIVSGDILSGGS